MEPLGVEARVATLDTTQNSFPASDFPTIDKFPAEPSVVMVSGRSNLRRVTPYEGSARLQHVLAFAKKTSGVVRQGWALVKQEIKHSNAKLHAQRASVEASLEQDRLSPAVLPAVDMADKQEL